jgi:hypothetical protein
VNSGWNWEATNHVFEGSSIISTRPSTRDAVNAGPQRGALHVSVVELIAMAVALA